MGSAFFFLELPFRSVGCPFMSVFFAHHDPMPPPVHVQARPIAAYGFPVFRTLFHVGVCLMTRRHRWWHGYGAQKTCGICGHVHRGGPIRKGQTYRVLAGDMRRGVGPWFGGEGRQEADLIQFYETIGKEPPRRSRSRDGHVKAVLQCAPAYAMQAQLVFDTFHIMRHPSKAMDDIRKTESVRLSGEDRRCVNARKCTALPSRESLRLEGRKALKRHRAPPRQPA